MKICRAKVFLHTISALEWTHAWADAAVSRGMSLGAKLSGTLPDDINRLHEQNTPQKSGNRLLIKICET